MAPEAAIASHACAHIGAVQVPIFSGFAGPAVSSRLADAGAKLVLTADASYRRGKLVPMKEVLDEALADAPSVEHVVVWRRAGVDCPMTAGRDVWWDDVVADQPGTLEPVEVESEAPYLLAYTSGTTGKPKGALHVQGGFLLSIVARDRLPGRSARRRPRALLDGHGLDHGPVDRRRRDGVRRDDRLHGGRARLAARPRLAARRRRARHDARRLADARAGAHPARRSRRRPLVAPLGRHDGRAVEPRAVRLARRARLREGPDPDRELLGRHRGRGLLPLRDDAAPDEAVLRRASPRSARTWTSSTTTGSPSAARSASSSASARGPA